MLAAFWAFVYTAPLPSLEEALDRPGAVVLAADGTVLQRDAKDGIRIAVPLEEIAPQAISATLAAEDQRFYDHAGLDPIAAARAALNVRSTRSGASTLTMQLARRVYLDGGGGWLPFRKAKEATVALWLEARYSKDEILNAYLNDVAYGRDAYGIEAAARVYFGTSAANLDLAQAAFLAGIPQNPIANDPDRDFVAAKARQRYVLDRLLAEGSIDGARYADALVEELHLLPERAEPVAPHFVAMALAELERVAPALAARGGLVIETTLDAGLQAEAERVAAQQLSRLQGRNAENASVVALDPRTGAVLALVGHAGDPTSQYVNLATAERQPGSALKPILYAAALERGLTLATPLLDVPTTLETADGAYSPQNYDRRFHGPVPIRLALASSYNVPAVRALESLGMDAFLEMAHRLGLSSLTDTERYGPSIVLGGGEVRLIDLASAFAVFAAGGERAETYLVTRVRDASGAVLYERPATQPVRVLAGETAWLITDALRDSEARVPGFGYRSPLETSVGAAVKTGTTTGFRDNWTVGYTPSLVVGAWVGNADGSPMTDVSGVDGAGPIWRDVIEAGSPVGAPAWAPPPAELVRVPVCSPTGLLPGADCPSIVDEWFVRGTEPDQREAYFVRDGAGRLSVDPPPEARAWAADAGLLLATDPDPVDAAGLRIVQPQSGAVFVAAPELETSEVVLRATAPGAGASEFSGDGELAGRGESGDVSVPWPVTPGGHSVEVRAHYQDGGSEVTTTTFEVREP